MLSLLRKYQLIYFLDDYMSEGTFPGANAWENSVNKTLHDAEEDRVMKSINCRPELGRIQLKFNGLTPNRLWILAQDKSQKFTAYSFLVKLSCRKKTSRECECGIVANDIDRHKVFTCKQLLAQRTALFEGITDALDVEQSVSFESYDEDSILADLLGGENTPLGRLP